MNYPAGMNDPLNLRDYIISFTAFLRENAKTAEPQSAAGFFDMLVDAVAPQYFPFSNQNENGAEQLKKEQEKMSKDLQKLLSGNISIERLKPFTDGLLSGCFDDALMVLFSGIAESVLEVDPAGAVFQAMCNKIAPRFFAEGEALICSQACADGHFALLMLLLLKHGFRTLDSIPAFWGRRIYEQALTFDFDSPVRFYLMKQAADNGVGPACIEYANYLAKRKNYDEPLSEDESIRFAEALRYFLQAGNYPPALWNIAFLLENNYVSSGSYMTIARELRIEAKLETEEYRSHLNELQSVTVAEGVENPSAIILAYKIHFYLAYNNEPFYKSFNSMANHLAKRQIVVSKDCALAAEELIGRYRTLAANAGDIMSIYNESSRLTKAICQTSAPEAYEIAYLSELLRIGIEAGLPRSYYYSAVLHEHLNSISYPTAKGMDEIFRLYQMAARQSKDRIKGDAYYQMGKLAGTTEEQERYFSQALQAGNADAAYDLALLWYRQYLLNKNDMHLLLEALNVLDQKEKYMVQNKSEVMLLQKLLQSASDEILRDKI